MHAAGWNYWSILTIKTRQFPNQPSESTFVHSSIAKLTCWNISIKFWSEPIPKVCRSSNYEPIFARAWKSVGRKNGMDVSQLHAAQKLCPPRLWGNFWLESARLQIMIYRNHEFLIKREKKAGGLGTRTWQRLNLRSFNGSRWFAAIQSRPGDVSQMLCHLMLLVMSSVAQPPWKFSRTKQAYVELISTSFNDSKRVTVV
jgi:hypothetical protein